jgi:hypothetical protein
MGFFLTRPVSSIEIMNILAIENIILSGYGYGDMGKKF